MAHVYPVNADLDNRAERLVLKRLRSDLSDEWTIIHSLKISDHPYKRVGEADFVAFTKDCLIVIEVKGGLIETDGHIWYQDSRPLKESPIDQADGNFFALEDFLKKVGWQTISGGGICIFPEANLSIPSSPSWKSFQFICARDFHHVGLSIGMEEARSEFISRYERLRKAEAPILNNSAICRLIEILLPQVVSWPAYDQVIAKDRRRIIELDDFQRDFIADINHPRILLNGPAGSGKTMLGYKACKNWLMSNPGKSAAFICSSTYLAKDIDRMVFQDGLDGRLYVYSAEALVGSIWLDMVRRDTVFDPIFPFALPQNGRFLAMLCGVQPPPVITVDQLKEHINLCSEAGMLETVLLPPFGEAFNELDYTHFNFDKAKDFVVVDEGQDFRNDPLHLSFINLRVRGGLNGGNVIWMQDLMQSVEAPNANYTFTDFPIFAPESLDYYQARPLNNNYRNPYSIGRLASKLIDSDGIIKSTGSRELTKPIFLLPVTIHESLGDRLFGLLAHLERNGVKLSEVILISVDGKTCGTLNSTTELGQYRLIYEDDVYDKNTISSPLPDKAFRWSRLADVKGREFPVVILIDLPQLDSEANRAKAYIAATRATSSLYLISEKLKLDQWKQILLG